MNRRSTHPNARGPTVGGLESPAPWVMLGFACAAMAAATFLFMFLLIGPGNLPQELKKNVQDRPWVFGLLILIGGGIAATGMHGVVHKRAFNVVEGSFAPDTYTGRTAVVIGSLQCLAGSIAAGACLYLLLMK